MQFVDHRKPQAIEHTVRELVAQRVLGLALGYEDLNDHDVLRLHPLMAAAADKADPTGQNRLCERDKGKALASSSTLNRLEPTPANAKAEARHRSKHCASSWKLLWNQIAPIFETHRPDPHRRARSQRFVTSPQRYPVCPPHRPLPSPISNRRTPENGASHLPPPHR